MEDYYEVWGIPAEVVARFKEEPYVEVWQLTKNGSGFQVFAKGEETGPDGEDATPKQEWTWHAPVKRHSPVGSKMLASASLVAPNTIQIIYLAEDHGITEIQTHKFAATGVEVEPSGYQ